MAKKRASGSPEDERPEDEVPEDDLEGAEDGAEDDELDSDEDSDEENESKSSDELFRDAIRAAHASQTDPTAESVYLGDVSAVDAIVRSFVMDILSLVGEQTDEAVEEVDSLLRRMAGIFLGKVKKGFIGIPKWNEPGGVDMFLVNHSLAPMDQDPEGRLKTFFFGMVGTVRDVVLFAAEDGVKPEQWNWQLDAEIGRFVSLLLGVYVDPDEDMAGGVSGGSVPAKPASGRTRTQEALMRKWGEYP